MTFNTLEDIRLWGVPIVIDDIPLTFNQAKVLVGIVEKLMDEAGYRKEPALKKSVEVFRQMYVSENDERYPFPEWKAKNIIQLNRHGITMRSKFYKQEQRLRIRRAMEDNIIDVFMEGRVRKGLGKKQFQLAVGSLVGMLDKDTVKKALDKVSMKVGKRVIYKGSK